MLPVIFFHLNRYIEMKAANSRNCCLSKYNDFFEREFYSLRHSLPCCFENGKIAFDTCRSGYMNCSRIKLQDNKITRERERERDRARERERERERERKKKKESKKESKNERKIERKKKERKKK